MCMLAAIMHIIFLKLQLLLLQHTYTVLDMKVYTCSIYLQRFVAESICLAKQLFPHNAPHCHSAGPLELPYSDPYNHK